MTPGLVPRDLAHRRAWLFDMDGTLTHAVHDFDAIRHTLGLPEGQPILEALDALPEALARRKRRELDDIEMEIAHGCTPQAGAEALLTYLTDAGARLGIVTRNGRAIADATLRACGLDGWFGTNDIVSRDCCAPKPDPAGIRLLLSRWQRAADDAVMVGDYRYDLDAGRRAGVATVHLDVDECYAFGDVTDLGVGSLLELLQQLRSAATTTR